MSDFVVKLDRALAAQTELRLAKAALLPLLGASFLRLADERGKTWGLARMGRCYEALADGHPVAIWVGEELAEAQGLVFVREHGAHGDTIVVLTAVLRDDAQAEAWAHTRGGAQEP